MVRILQCFRNYMKNEEISNRIEDKKIITQNLYAVHEPSNYSFREVESAITVFKLLIKVRNRCRKKGLIDW